MLRDQRAQAKRKGVIVMAASDPIRQRVDYHIGGLQDIEDEIELRLQQGWIIIQPPSLAYDLDHKRFAALVVYLVP